MSGIGGAGRGKLLQILQQTSQATSDISSIRSTDDEQTASKGKPADRSCDSGVKIDSVSGVARGMSRGKFFASLAESSAISKTDPSISSAEEVSDAGPRRGQFFSSLSSSDPEPGLDIQAITHSNISRLQRLQLATAAEAKLQPSYVPSIPEEESPSAVVESDDEVDTAVVERVGKSGKRIGALTNYIRIQIDPEKGVFEYEVRFAPAIHAAPVRFKLLNQHRELIGNTKTFDGVTLFLPMKLPENITKLKSENPNDGSAVIISIHYRRKKKMSDCVQLYGILFDRIMRTLKFIRFGKKNFDPSEPKVVPQHKLEVRLKIYNFSDQQTSQPTFLNLQFQIFPGYVTAVDEYSGGIMVCVDITHRALCQTTVLEKMVEAFQSSRGNTADFRAKILTALLGSVVLTRYNNKTYRIDDIDFDSNPTKTFKTTTGEISYVEYYKRQYNIEIRDLKQPLLIHRKETRKSGSEEPVVMVFCIIPEICYLTGLTDEMRNDFKVMRDIATYTRISPNQRVNALNQFCKRVNSTPETREILSGWGLTIDPEPVRLEIRQLDEQQIIFGKNKTFPAGRNADFGRHATNNELLDVVHLRNWLVIHTRNDGRVAKAFIDCMERNSRPMGITVMAPRAVILNDDRTETYIQTLRKELNSETQIVVAICPTSRDDRYAAIKKICCAELPIPSQVINARTLSNDAKNRAIVQKIALQMNCKLGGTLWSIKIPLKNVMICGIDTYHEVAKKSKSVSAFVASLNSSYTRWYSKAIIQNKNEELVHGLVVSLQKSLEAYRKMNNELPERIIIYRDGVGDGQLKMCEDYELAQLKDACKLYSDGDYKPLFTFIVVQKRINTRIYASTGTGNADNPNPGAILDNMITRRNLYDFYLVPQSVRQGTVTPTHMVVVQDMANFSPDILQQLSYKLCFLYYNWPGTVRVPACCQYAHKLAYLVGQSVKCETAENLADKLFYL